ncbi:unnamed protein product [Nippostrongylus brasiliensis]|uniref:Leprecan-like alpha-helical domain-containing protein n=1 Tax=Nippostrongylus brasiliensis TaxID=27835 RepID=A0A0N4YC64_NIPBR|nr:unnamed protein product [Nippostrongylus brasiliensis]
MTRRSGVSPAALAPTLALSAVRPGQLTTRLAMAILYWTPLFVFYSIIDRCHATPDDPQLTFEQLYQYGKYEYTDKNWPDCVAYFEDELVWCRRKCAGQVEKPDESSFSQKHATSERALCMLRCKRERFTEERPPLGKMSTYFDFVERKPYQYMHICYWRKSFISGVQAYNDEDWNRCVDDLQFSMEKLMEEDARCRLLCDDKIDWSVVHGNPEIDVLITSMQAAVVRCQHNCLHRLALINGHNVGDLPAVYYEYLHYCQYKLMRGSEAARSVANYLLFDNSPTMRRNKYFYLKQYKKPELFEPDEVSKERVKVRPLLYLRPPPSVTRPFSIRHRGARHVCTSYHGDAGVVTLTGCYAHARVPSTL